MSALKHPSFTAMSKYPFDVDVVDVLVVEEVLVVLAGAVVSSGGLSSGLQFLSANILGSSTGDICVTDLENWQKIWSG